jgi:NTE family protein
MSERVSLALGGGAAKGLAHVGVLRGLDEDGVDVAAIAGTSMGSVVGALHARGMSAAEMEAFFAAVDWRRLGWIMLRSVGGAAFRDLIRETIGTGPIEALGLPFAAACCDLATGDEVVLRAGSLEQAVRASSAIPGILPPVVVDGRTLVDGAMVTPVPHTAAASLAGAEVLAVNVLRPPLPGRLDVLVRASHLMQYNLARIGAGTAPTIEPLVGHIGWFDFHRAREIMDEGYRAYRAWRSNEGPRAVTACRRRGPS